MGALILEGGTFRPIFSSGVMDALLDYEVDFPYVIGVSAGITDGFSYVSKQTKRNYDILMKKIKDVLESAKSLNIKFNVLVDLEKQVLDKLEGN